MKNTHDTVAELFIKLSVIDTVESEETKKELRETLYNMSPITQILCNRLNAVNIGIKLDPVAGYMISLCANGNPGMSIMLLYEGIKRARNGMHWSGETFDLAAFAYAYPNNFPIIYDTDKFGDPLTPIGEEFSALWDKQKIYNQTDEILQKCKIPKNAMTDNMVDFDTYWKLLVEEPAV